MATGIPFQNRGRREGDQILWLLFNHRIEFSTQELQDLVYAIRNGGLFRHLDKERPALHDQMHAILGEDLPESIFESEAEEEFFLEQCLLGLSDRFL